MIKPDHLLIAYVLGVEGLADNFRLALEREGPEAALKLLEQTDRLVSIQYAALQMRNADIDTAHSALMSAMDQDPQRSYMN